MFTYYYQCLVLGKNSCLGKSKHLLSQTCITLIFDRHVVKGGLKWHCHHGKTKFVHQDELDGINVVLTTYHTVSAEWKNEKDAENSILFSVCWKRIILDEG